MSTPLLLVAAGAAAPAARADVNGPDIVSYVNAMRSAQGIPAGIAHDPSLSDACARHDRYGAANDLLTHDEVSGKAGYTASGAAVAKLSVLYAADRWTAAHDPFELAPIHLHQLLAPRLSQMGAYETQGYGCATTLTGRGRAAPDHDVVYSYPGPGATGWPTAQIAREFPHPPGVLVGIPQGTRTGPYLYVSLDGPGVKPSSIARLSGATLTGPDGDVPIATVDNETPGLGLMIPPGGELIPRAPLQPNATYTASATLQAVSGGSSGTVTRTWSFTTGPGGSRPGIAGDDDGVQAAAGSSSSSSSSSSSGTSGTAKPKGGVADGAKTAPKALAVVAKTARLHGKTLRVTVNCRAACKLATRGKLKLPSGRTAAFRASTALKRAGRARIDVRLADADAKRARKATTRRPLTVTVVATAASGSHSDIRKHLPLRKS